MCRSVIVIGIIVFLSSSVLTHKLTDSRVYESFLPSLINVRPVIQMRSTGNNRQMETTLIDLKNFTYAIYPQYCGECKHGFLVVVIVLSYVGNFENRMAIRETWGNPTNCTIIVFFTGTTYDKTIMKNLVEESTKYGDLVQGNIEDTYRNLAYKHVMALKWVNQFCTAKYVVKTDADIIIRLDKLYELMVKDVLGGKRLIAGHIEKREKVLRDTTSSMKSRIVSREEYAPKFYPPYCWGQFIVYSADIIPSLIEQSKKVPYFKIEDIYVTGLLAKNIKDIRHVDIAPDWYLSRATIANYTEKDARKNYVYGPYSITGREMREFWKSISNLKTSLPNNNNLKISRRVLEYWYQRK